MRILIKESQYNVLLEHDIDWILMCWASKGFKDINLFLSDLNKLAYQETNQTDNTRLT